MSRQVLIAEDKRGQDLSRVNLAYGYSLRVDYRETVFGNVIDHTFVECDLRNSDWTKALSRDCAFHSCRTAGMRLGQPTAFAARMVAEMAPSVFVPHMNQQFIAATFRRYVIEDANLRAAFDAMADDVMFRHDLCFADFARIWCARYLPWKANTRLAKRLLSMDDGAWGAWVNTVVPILAPYYPSVPQEEWLARD